ncbi:MAG: hypothetical protein AAF307_11695 [Pseudomonadota bacterium]
MFERYYAPLMTALWMIGVPLVLRFIETAGAGSVLNGLAYLAGTLWSAFGAISIGLGVLVLVCVLGSALLNGPRTSGFNG